MIVSDVRVEPHGDTNELSALLDGFRFWFRFPESIDVAPRGDPFLAATFLVAMGAGEPLEITPDAPVSPQLLEGVDRYQEIYQAWYPTMKKVPIRCLARAAETEGRGVGLFFSGGIDSTYSFLRHRDEITHLVFCLGFDVNRREWDRCAAAIERNQRFADAYGKQFVLVETNPRELPVKTPLTMRWGSSLGGVALALGLSRVYIGASHTYNELMRWDSHPLTDELLSTEATRIVHDGAERRSTKLKRIAQDSKLGMEILRVCGTASTEYNCGKCEKCLRTMVSLHLLGEKVPFLPALESVRQLKRLRIPHDVALTFWEDNLLLARERGDRRITRLLTRKVRGFKIRRALKQLDQDSFGGILRKSKSLLVRSRGGR